MNNKKTFFRAAALALALAAPVASEAKIIKVGTGWGMDKDYDTLQELITANHASKTADEGATNSAWTTAEDEIWLIGTQELDGQWGLNTDNVSRWQGKLIGGFDGTEASANDRKKVADGSPWEFQTPTVIKLKADAGRAANQGILMMSQAGTKTFTEIDGITFDGVNCTAGVMQFRNGWSVTTLKNCIVENGDATKSDGTPRYGIVGGISIGNPDGNVWQSDHYVDEDDSKQRQSNFFIDGCLIQNNKGLGVWFSTRNAASIKNSTIKNNAGVAGQKGGGIVIKTVKTDIENCIIEGNTADSIAGVYVDAASLVVDEEGKPVGQNADNQHPSLIRGSTIRNNTATLPGAVIYANSGVTVTTTYFVDNKSADAEDTQHVDEGTGIDDEHKDANGNLVTYEEYTPSAIPAVATVANASFYSEAGTLYVTPTTAQAVKVYTIAGVQVFAKVIEGTASITLPHGVYIVKVGQQSYKVIVR